MSFLVLHMNKYKKEAVRGIQSHNQRERKSHSNPDIDYQQSASNYYLPVCGKVNFRQKIDARIDALNLQKTLRHDAVHMCGLIVSSDREFFKNLPPDEVQRFFQESHNFLTEFVGKENVITSVVHMDESTPHMHFAHVPVTRDGRLNANQIYTKISLRQLQNGLPEYLQSKGFVIERGVEQVPGAAKKHLATREFKQQQEALKNLETQANNVTSELQAMNKALEQGRQEESALNEKLKSQRQKAETADAVLKYNANLPKPTVFNYKSVVEEAIKIIEMQKDALAAKWNTDEINQWLMKKQAKIDDEIFGIKKEAQTQINNLQKILQDERTKSDELRKNLRRQESAVRQAELFMNHPKTKALLQEFEAEQQKQRSHGMGMGR